MCPIAGSNTSVCLTKKTSFHTAPSSPLPIQKLLVFFSQQQKDFGSAVYLLSVVSVFNKRRKILNDWLRTHCGKKFYLCVLCLYTTQQQQSIQRENSECVWMVQAKHFPFLRRTSIINSSEVTRTSACRRAGFS